MKAIRRIGPAWAALAVAAFLLIIVAGAVIAGYQAGLAKHASASATQMAAEAAHQYELGVADVEAGHLLTAAERFRYVLSLDPAHGGAAEKLAEVEEALRLTAAAPTVAPTPPAPPSLDPAAEPADLLGQAEAALDRGDWDKAISLLEGLQRSDSGFEAARVQIDLLQAYRDRGVARIDDYRLQEGILDLDHAEIFGELDDEAAARRVWATLYVRGNALWGADWPSAIAIFEDLYRAAPYFFDTFDKLHGAYAAYGDQLWAGGDPCNAVSQFARANELQPDPDMEGKRQAAAEACAQVTPTPGPGTPAATLEGTPAEAPSATPAP